LRRDEGGFMEWTRILAYITGSANQELLLRNERLAAENRILRAKRNGRRSAKLASNWYRWYRWYRWLAFRRSRK
jgi:hypothetical protein